MAVSNRSADIQPGVTELPPGCAPANCVKATSDGTYPYVFNNALVDGSFGVASPLFLEQVSPGGRLLKTIPVPPQDLVTSFSSKSEGALNLSTDRQDLTFIDYVAPIGAIDVSNSNTPWVVDPTNPVPGAYYRAVADMSRGGRFHLTAINAYSGNNGRAAILNSAKRVFYMAGNAGNGGNPQPPGVVLGAGAQILSPAFAPIWDQFPSAQPTPVGNFNITELGYKPDKLGKDDNFRGLTINNNVLYYTKGSGSNGVNTVYFVDTTGKACPSGGVGLPVSGAALPTSPFVFDANASDPNAGQPTNMCVLKGFNTQLAKNDTSHFPFGIWFANPTTLYVADEGDGKAADAAASTTAGLQKWVLKGGQWTLQYTIQSGLKLGQPYTVPGYPTGTNPATGQPWAPATDGLRNITGRVNGNGTVTIYAVTSTVSGSGDQGADPNQVAQVTDEINDPGATGAPAGDSFQTVAAPRSGRVYRGVSFTPGTSANNQRSHGRHGNGG